MYEADTQNIKAAIGELLPEERRSEFDREDLFSSSIVTYAADCFNLGTSSRKQVTVTEKWNY